jgi:hypothetical protein
MLRTPIRSGARAIDIGPLHRAAHAGGPLAAALSAVGFEGLAAYGPTTHDDRILGPGPSWAELEKLYCSKQ